MRTCSIGTRGPPLRVDPRLYHKWRIVIPLAGTFGETGRGRSLADEVVCLGAPDNFHALGWWYDRFEPTTDAEVLELLAAGRPASRNSR